MVPLETKRPPRETEVPQRLHFQTLRVARFHGHLQKVRVVLKVHWVTELSRIVLRLDSFRGDVQNFD
jgi:hypothetical protein